MSSRHVLARTLLTALVLTTAVPTMAHAAQGTPVLPAMTPLPMPTPGNTPLPYPAYGSPAPDVSALKAKSGVPAQVTLTQAIDIAVAQSPAFAAQRAQYRAIAAKYGAEKGAVLPGVSATGSITRDYGSSQGSGSGGSATPAPGARNPVVTSETGRINVTQLIFDGGQAIAGIRSAKESDIAGRDALLRQLQSLAFNVATAYYSVQQADATVQANAALVRQFEQQESSVTAQIRAGAAARSDLAAAQFQSAQARGALITAQGALIGAQAAFATTLGLDADTQVVPQTEGANPPQVKTYGYDQSLSQALNLRPDYLAAQHSVDSANQNLRFAKLARFPNLTANASSGTDRTLINTGAVASQYSGSSSLGATLTFPIYDRGLTNFNIAQAASAYDQAVAGLQTSKLTVESDVRGALAGLISARASLIQAQAEQQSGLVSLQATQARYKVGAASITDVITAEANNATAQRDYVNALYSERLAEEKYTFALGASDLKL